MSELVEISKQTREWGEKEFLYELPDKRKLSFTAWESELIGYAILSRRWPDRIHIHQFMVKSTLQNKGLGSQVMRILKDAHTNDLLH